MDYTISEAEWKVMEILWEKRSATIMDIARALEGSGWHYSTIKTLVHRLYKKGAAGADDTTGKFKYYPIATQNECLQSETASFVKRIYGGSVKMLMASLANNSALNKKEVDEILRIIDKMEDDTSD